MRVAIAEPPTFLAAWAQMHEVMINQFGTIPGPLNDLIIQVLDCPHEGSNRRGTVLIGHPRGDGVRANNTVVVYFGDSIVLELAC